VRPVSSVDCYDMYISDEMVARTAKGLTGSDSQVSDLNKGPRNQISAARIQALGMRFGGRVLLEETVRQMLQT
jgi:hypothetical protein